jgi:hypothetical protein
MPGPMNTKNRSHMTAAFVATGALTVVAGILANIFGGIGISILSGIVAAVAGSLLAFTLNKDAADLATSEEDAIKRIKVLIGNAQTRLVRL